MTRLKLTQFTAFSAIVWWACALVPSEVIWTRPTILTGITGALVLFWNNVNDFNRYPSIFKIDNHIDNFLINWLKVAETSNVNGKSPVGVFSMVVRSTNSECIRSVYVGGCATDHTGGRVKRRSGWKMTWDDLILYFPTVWILWNDHKYWDMEIFPTHFTCIYYITSLNSPIFCTITRVTYRFRYLILGQLIKLFCNYTEII